MGGGPPQHTDLKDLVRGLARNGPVRIQKTPKRIRLLFNGAFIADTTSAFYIWEHDYYPQFYLPMNSFVKPPGFDITLSHGEPITESNSSSKIIGGYLEIAVRRADNSNEEYRIINDMAIFASDLQGPAKYLRDYVKISFNAIDQWFEEDTPIYVHPKDPTKRIDLLPSTTPIRITIPIPSTTSSSTNPTTLTITDLTLAESSYSIHLHEPLLPTRYYLPYPFLSTIHLRSSTTISECPYKGVANYHSVVVEGQTYPDLVWWYRCPTLECSAIAGMRCFFTEKVDVWFWREQDGKWVKQERPTSHMA